MDMTPKSSRDDGRLKLAVQKSGRLTDKSFALLEKAGISLTKSKDQLLCRARNFPLDIFLVRDDDIPAFLANDVCQLGIIGQNTVLECRALSPATFKGLDQVVELGFGRCRLSIAVPDDMTYKGLADLKGRTIATSYEGLLGKFLKSNGIKASIVTMEGAVEIAPRTHLADVICDLVSTGNTLASNGLVEKETILDSQAVIMENTNMTKDLRKLSARLLERINAVLRASHSRYIMLNAPLAALDEIKAILPGSRAPTVMPLQGREDMVAVHAVCEEDVFWATMEDLKSKGADSILVAPIEKMLD